MRGEERKEKRKNKWAVRQLGSQAASGGNNPKNEGFSNHVPPPA